MPDLVVLMIYLSFVFDFVVFPIPSKASTMAITKQADDGMNYKTIFLWLTHAVILLTWLVPLIVALYYTSASGWHSHPAIYTSGILFAITGRAITLGTSLSLIRFRKNSTTKAVLTTGLFALSRHPIVLGLHLTLAGLLLSTDIEWMLIPFLLSLYYFDYKLDIEEQQLLATHGNEYALYIENTRRYLNWPWRNGTNGT